MSKLGNARILKLWLLTATLMSELVTVEIQWWEVVDNSLAVAFKEHLSCGSVVLCREPKALFLG